MNKNKLFNIIFILILFLVCVAAILLYIFVFRIPKPQEIFVDSQNYVVEIKSQSDEDNISYGSAVLIKNDGTFVTNAHVVTYKKGGVYQVFDKIEIRFSDEEEFRSVSLLKYDIDKDIAFVKLDDISGLELNPTNIQNDYKATSGETVYAVGNGLNHGISINKGIVSIPSINIEYKENIRNVIQCDLVINDGNSGGALLDQKGNLLGITTFRLKDNSGNVVYGVAYCIPIAEVIEYLNA